MTAAEFLDATPEQLREAYAASEARFRALLENAADVMLIIGADGRIKHISQSAQRIVGHDPEDITGQLSFDFIHPDDQEQTRAFLEQTFSAREPQHGERFRGRDGDGNWRVFEPVGLNMLDDPAVEGAVFIARDVTERHALEQRLRNTDRLEAIGQLAGGIAHDFNNVLLVIRGYSSVLRSALGDSELAPDVDEIAKAADRAADLTRQLLAFARRQVLKPTLVDLREVVVGIEKLLRRSVSEDIEMRFDLHRDVGPVLADPSQLEQVLLNLVLNARDAIPGRGRIVVSIAPAMLEPDAQVSPTVAPGAYVALTVTDTGTGIDASDLPHIFEPFFTTKEEGVGTGLGLSTVYGVVAQTGGGIEVAARPDGGTRMTAYLPAAVVDAEPEADEQPPAARLPGGSETILLVEDEDPVRDLVRRVLEGAGYEVLATGRPTEAQRLAAETPIDLLLTDVVMPEMNGYELATQVRVGHPDVRTLFISGYAHKAIGDAAELPPGELLRKPFSPDQLTRAVRALLDGEAVEAA